MADLPPVDVNIVYYGDMLTLSECAYYWFWDSVHTVPVIQRSVQSFSKSFVLHLVRACVRERERALLILFFRDAVQLVFSCVQSHTHWAKPSLWLP